MKAHRLFLILVWCSAALAAEQASPSVDQAAAPAPPPAAALRTAADLEKLVAPIALYPDPLIATILPASVYPLEIVQAARFVADTNNLATLDAQAWDQNVKAVARVPGVIEKLNKDLPWTMELGEAFLAQDKDLMDAIQRMRGKAQQAGSLQTSPQQIVTVTNIVVEKTIEQQVVVVTNTVVQIQPSNPEVVYVPQYNPAVVYAPPPPSADPAGALITFGVGMLVGAAIADNNCDWNYGGCYHGDVDIDVDRNINVNQNVNVNRNANVNANANINANRGTSAQASATGAPKKWQPDQSRLTKSGSPNAAASARTGEARGWSSAGASPSAATAAARPASGTAASRPSGAAAATRPSAGTVGAGPSTGAAPANRAAAAPSASPNVSRPTPSPAASTAANRTSPSPTASQSRPTASTSASAFSGTARGNEARSASSRGAASRASAGGGAGGGGAGRAGGRAGGR